MAYPFHEFEQNWQDYWRQNKTFRADDDYSKPKYFVMDMFPYPSGKGLHVGHAEGYTATDIVAKYYKLRGFNVLHPMGFDEFGLPTERYSMETGIHPKVATANNIANYKRQLTMLGLGYDWDREVNTSDPAYYKWTQFIFMLIYNSWFDEKQNKARPIDELPIPGDLTSTEDIERYRDERRLAYIDEMPVNWCEELGTVLANEEVDEWRDKGYTVERRPMRQWMLRITAYADRLLEDLDSLDWPHSTKEMQRHWIGKSEGAEIRFPIDGHDGDITVFTTRPDTIFGATYMVLAPEHALVDLVAAPDQKTEVESYRSAASAKSDVERMELKEKTGVFTGGYATNPATGRKIPIWIADYVLAHYGFGAVMAVPGHDERDHEFAKRYAMPIVKVVEPSGDADWDIESEAFAQDGVNVHSANDSVSLNGLATPEAKRTIIEWLETQRIGAGKTQFKLRDWLFSRQRYWGDPIPIIFFEDGSKRSLELDELPLTLPDVQEYKPAKSGESPLATVPEWVDFVDPKTGKRGRYETNTMPQWAGSCWYYLRYLDVHNNDQLCDLAAQKYWMGENGVDLYIGGSEHAVLHLLYARFWHKALYDYGLVTAQEPFRRLFHQGMILAEDMRKMSKSLGNVINPDDVVKEYGADSLRLFEMFMGPLEMTKPWSTKGVEGVYRFLSRVWRLVVDDEGRPAKMLCDEPTPAELEMALHATIKKTGEDIESLGFNTAIAQMMIFVNECYKAEIAPRDAVQKFLICLAPFAPHISEELWRRLGHNTSIFTEQFPAFDPLKLVRDEIEFVVQIKGKVRAKTVVPNNADQETVENIVLALPNVQKHVDGKTIHKKIFVPNKLINLIVS